ncbi:MAG: GNAT family N-acetyltransferase [Pseudomonadota bacterium]
MSEAGNKPFGRGQQIPNYDLRPGTQDDFPFTRALYIQSMKPLLSALDAWDADKADTAFRSYFITEEIQIITLKGKDIGWYQVSVTETELCLDQIHLLEEARCSGIGTQIINKVIDEATRKGRDVSLSLVKGNPSRALYERLGFRLVDEDETKFHMLRRLANKSENVKKAG